MAEPSRASIARSAACSVLAPSIWAVMAPLRVLLEAEAPIERLPVVPSPPLPPFMALARAMSRPPVIARICSSLLAVRVTSAAVWLLPGWMVVVPIVALIGLV